MSFRKYVIPQEIASQKSAKDDDNSSFFSYDPKGTQLTDYCRASVRFWPDNPNILGDDYPLTVIISPGKIREDGHHLGR